MSKQVLDVQQMQHLQELGLDTSNASMCLIKDTEGNRHLSVHDEYCYEANFMNPIPAYTLQDVLDALPHSIGGDKEEDYWLQIEQMERNFDDWRVSYVSVSQDKYFHCFQSPNLIDAAYSLLCWAIENKFVETNKNE